MMRIIKVGVIALIWILVFDRSVFAGDPNAKVIYDPEKDRYIIQYTLFDGSIYTTNLELPNKIDPIVKGEVEKNSVNEKLVYRYTVTNDQSSRQNLVHFYAPFYMAFSFQASPRGWDGGEMQGKSLLDWFWSEDQHFSPDEIVHVRDIGMKPGEEQGGFSFASEGLPGIVTAYFEGEPRVFTIWKDEPPLEIEAELDKFTIFPMGAVQRKTVGPVAPPAHFIPLDFLAYLIDLKHQAADLGWIGGPKLVEELDKKLDQVKEKLTANEIEPAVGKLKSFIEKVEAHYKEIKEHEIEKIKEGKEEKKFVTSEGYALLKFNAEYLREQLVLPKEPGDKEEHEEKEEDKGPKR